MLRSEALHPGDSGNAPAPMFAHHSSYHHIIVRVYHVFILASLSVCTSSTVHLLFITCISHACFLPKFSFNLYHSITHVRINHRWLLLSEYHLRLINKSRLPGLGLRVSFFGFSGFRVLCFVRPLSFRHSSREDHLFPRSTI